MKLQIELRRVASKVRYDDQKRRVNVSLYECLCGSGRIGVHAVLGSTYEAPGLKILCEHCASRWTLEPAIGLQGFIFVRQEGDDASVETSNADDFMDSLSSEMPDELVDASSNDEEPENGIEHEPLETEETHAPEESEDQLDQDDDDDLPPPSDDDEDDWPDDDLEEAQPDYGDFEEDEYGDF